MFVAIQPTSVYSTEGILSLTPERRKCWLPNEQELKYHVNYTRANCLTECMAEKMEEVCGCVPYYVFKPSELRSSLTFFYLVEIFFKILTLITKSLTSSVCGMNPIQYVNFNSRKTWVNNSRKT